MGEIEIMAFLAESNFNFQSHRNSLRNIPTPPASIDNNHDNMIEGNNNNDINNNGDNNGNDISHENLNIPQVNNTAPTVSTPMNFYVERNNHEDEYNNNSSNFLTPARYEDEHEETNSTIEPTIEFESVQNSPIDYSTKVKVEEFQESDRIDYIQMKFKKRKLSFYQNNDNSSLSSCATPEPAEPSFESTPKKLKLGQVELQMELKTWKGESIYSGLPQVAMNELDKILKESHKSKIIVIKKINEENPINYEYNPKKSRTRVNYEDPLIAENRTKNNIASRKSRHRKKYNTTINEYSVDYDIDENHILEKQIEWLKSLINNQEQKFIDKNSSSNYEDDLIKMRSKFGLK